ncbi:MAG: lysine--tRNA ligase [Oscillospiraceae bacterium]|nr:lysine--tRNA ligase [Oscillospiraceae bacterium]
MSEETRTPTPETELSEILQIRREKLANLQQEGRDPFQQTRFERSAWSVEVRENYAELEGKTVRVAGRIMSKRGMGKAIFCHIQDAKGQLQIYVRSDSVPDQEFADFRKYDIGDIVGVSGYVFKTKTEEISVHAETVELLSKSLRPLPEKYHGMTNTELKYRQRYVDLIMSEESRRNFIIRSQFVSYIRRFLDARGYMEVETPVLSTISGGATARPFITHHNTLDIDMYMRIATELHLKRLIVGGLERVYEIGRIFRNEGMDTKHNPEFTSVELYEAYTDFNGMMDLFEELLSGAAKEILGTYDVEWQGEKISLAPPFRRMTMAEAVKEHIGVDFMTIESDADAVEAAKSVGVDMGGVEPTWGHALYECYDQKVEEKMIQPTFITMHPVDVSPLAKRSPSDPRLTERFELFICRSEMGNAFSELNDPIDQKQRFLKQAELRAKGDEEAGMMDNDFINALEYGMPPTGGLGIGIDRCVMLLTGASSIRDVILFPTMKPLDMPKKEEKTEAAPVEAATEVIAEPEKIDFTNVVIEPLFEEQVDFETFSKSDFRAVKVLECEAVPKSKKLLKFTLDDGSGIHRTILSGIHAYYEPEQLIGKTCIAITNLPPRKMMGIDSCGMLISAVHKEGEEEKLHLLMVDPHIPAGAKLY